jgi:cell division protein FtsB
MTLKTRLIVLTAYFFLAAIIGGTGYLAYNFLNKNFYQAISESNEISDLQKNITASSINIEEFNNILGKLEKKKNGYSDIQTIKDPFD